MFSGHTSPDALIIVTAILSSFATVFVVLRIYARYAIAKNAGIDDAFIIVSLAFSWVTTSTMVLQAKSGLGQHVWELDAGESLKFAKAFWWSIIVYNISLTATKLSILLQYLRIFPQRTFRRCAWTLMGFVIVYFLWRFFFAIFACWPINAYWDHSVKPDYCFNRTAVSFTSAALNMVTDLAIAILPLPLLNKLELPKRQKRALMAVFSLGGFVCVVSIIRLGYLYVAIHSKDTSYHNGMSGIWSSTECNVGIICSCIPTLRCLFPKIFKNRSYMLSGHSSSNNTGKAARTFATIRSKLGHSTRADSVVASSSKTDPSAESSRKDQWESADPKGYSDVDDIELGIRIEGSSNAKRQPGMMVPANGQIRVNTVIEQVSSVGNLSPSESTRELVRQQTRDTV